MTLPFESSQIMSIGNFISFIQNPCFDGWSNKNNIPSFSFNFSKPDSPYIQSDGKSVEFPHDDIFKAAAYQLVTGFKDLRSYKSGHVVHVNPGGRYPAGVLLGFSNLHFKQAGKTILAGFVDDHVRSLSVAVCEVSALAGFKIEPVLPVFWDA